MAARKKSTKKAARKKATKKATVRKAPAKKATKKSVTKKAVKKTAVAAKPAAKKPAPKRLPTPRKSPAELAAERIIKITVESPENLPLEELYHPECISHEPMGEPAVGHAGLREKLAYWHEVTKGSRFKPRNVFVSGNTVCIEWDSEVDMRDGRTIQLQEIAIHEIQGSKIIAERYYYDPSRLSPPASDHAGPVADVPAPPKPPPPVEASGEPRIDPVDL